MKVCQICDKKTATGNNVSHSRRRTKRIWQPNMIKARVLIDGENKKAWVCAKCKKAQTKNL